jgi:hypothetical protein
MGQALDDLDEIGFCIETLGTTVSLRLEKKGIVGLFHNKNSRQKGLNMKVLTAAANTSYLSLSGIRDFLSQITVNKHAAHNEKYYNHSVSSNYIVFNEIYLTCR